MSAKPTLVVLSPRFPYPIEKGDKLRLYHQLQALVTQFEVHLVSLSDHNIKIKDQEVIDELVQKSHIILQKKFRLLKSIPKFLFGSKPMQVNYYDEPRIKRKIADLLKEIKPDLVYVQLIRIAQMVEHFNGPMAIDYMDAMSLNMQRESKFRSYFMRKIFGLEAQKVLKVEKCVDGIFHRKFIISKPDKEYLESKGIDNLEILRNGVDVDFFNPDLVGKSERKYDLGFVGNMGYLPNILAAEFLVENILEKSNENYKILIAGARPHKRVKKLARENVDVSGWMNDIRDAYTSSKLMVAPIFSGAGQQNKILEAMALGKVCITTPQVNDAINAEEGKEIFTAKTEDEFIEKINYLLNNPELCVEIGKNARNFVVNNYKWHIAGNLLNNKLLELLK